MLKKRILAIIVVLCPLIISSCQQEVKKTPPTLLEGKKIDVSSILKKRGNDVIDALYEELVSGSEELQDLEKQIKALKENSQDSLEAFKTFNDKNSSYYSAAATKINSIGDSALRKKIRGIIAKSRSNYMDSVASYISLDSLVNSKTIAFRDLYTLLKLIKTLPLIEEFQKHNAPKSTPAQGVIKEYDSLITRLDSLAVIKPTDKQPAQVQH